MLRLPAVAGRFYPSNPAELTALIHKYVVIDSAKPPMVVKACLVPHAGYVYSGHVAGAVLARIALPRKIIVLGVRHYPRGEPAAILSSGAWRTPLGDARIDEELAEALKKACPLLREDSAAHSAEHSLEVQLPFLQVLAREFTFVPVALGTVRFESLVEVGEAIGSVLEIFKEDVLLLTTSDLNHYEDDATTRVKDGKAIDQLLRLNARRLYDTCHEEKISMCGLGPAVAMLTALSVLGGKKPELVKYATSADVSGDRSAVVGYAGMIFS
ncbi:MAG TPA: AmmeMemoRadiSam system protein B [Candidatus Acidoferrum sp.]|nr:AmmeMemoRadiSam system protein B [Candidatus Acidoferrum sp.]